MCVLAGWVGAGVMGGGQGGAAESKPADREGLLGSNSAGLSLHNIVDHNYDKSHKYDGVRHRRRHRRATARLHPQPVAVSHCSCVCVCEAG